MRRHRYGFRPTRRLVALLGAMLMSLALWCLLYVSSVMVAWMWFGCLVVLALAAMVFYESGDFHNASWPLTILAYAFWPLTLIAALIYLAIVGTAGAGKQADTATATRLTDC
ncbi:hypothetical protein [Rhizobium sp. 9140]|uniref:hypothetical protein n=1 Tax=Rhizobium sp. 9140 TaxID=1761900 RepID=UPI00079732B1|nr:hypothetical protein [Rhizobium sp. 9140]CZT35874.1 hypothetical protein GA0004734_00028800 [Rhizobium sp. 9140]